MDKCNIIEPVADAEAKALEAAAAAPGAPKSKKYRLLPSAEDVERARRERASYAPLGPDFNLERLVRGARCPSSVGFLQMYVLRVCVCARMFCPNVYIYIVRVCCARAGHLPPPAPRYGTQQSSALLSHR